MNRWCNQCHSYGHIKWLWGGTHWTHRLYMRLVIRRLMQIHRKMRGE